jgi:hypothetical protein
LFASGLYPLLDREIEWIQALCDPSLDWESFDALVGRHRLLPTIYRNLKTHAPELVPSHILAGFKERAERNQRLILHNLAELGRVSKLFAAEGIQLCAVKGPLLSQRLFGDASLRTSRDIDLLVHPEAVARAEALLLANGYQRNFPTRTLTPHQWQIYLQHWRHFVYYHPQRHVLIELHWALTSTNMVSMQAHHQMLSRARPVTFAGATLYTLSEEDLPVNLLIHGSLHCWIRLKWLVDFVAWMRQADDPDWEGLKARMGDLGLQRLLAQGVLLANWLFHPPIPETVQALIEAEPAAQYLADRSLKFVSNAEITDEEMENVLRFRYILYWMRLRKGLRYKWNTLTKYSVNPRDWMVLPLPDALYPLYWPLRPFLRLKREPSLRRGDAPEDIAN